VTLFPDLFMWPPPRRFVLDNSTPETDSLLSFLGALDSTFMKSLLNEPPFRCAFGSLRARSRQHLQASVGFWLREYETVLIVLPPPPPFFIDGDNGSLVESPLDFVFKLASDV